MGNKFRDPIQSTKFHSNKKGEDKVVGQLFMVNNTFESTFEKEKYKGARSWAVDDGGKIDGVAKGHPMGSVYCRNTIWSSFGEPFFDKNKNKDDGVHGVYNFDHNLYHSTKASGSNIRGLADPLPGIRTVGHTGTAPTLMSKRTASI